ncbi:F-box/LRR-repeat protein 13-like [Brassica rapa]|uniref:F-box/LRR-repeat protein 13-like n=1 Tax=Brassica campestris TaxID=3711 RepID=UPI0004F16B77|nr:F-box/LRR-repeat protein 13-like [Brassica rapa]
MFTFMDTAGVKRARYTSPPGEVDRLSSLPDCLIFHVLLNLPTKDVVQTSLLSPRWTHLWKHVPGLDLDTEDFKELDTFVTVVDSFLERNRGSSVHCFKLAYDSPVVVEPNTGLVKRWLDAAAKLKVKHLNVSDNSSQSWDLVMSPTVYTCSSLVSLRLVGLTLPNTESVSLPSLKAMVLLLVEFTNNRALENLISKCPVLENLCIERSYGDGISILRVHSKSLLTFMHDAGNNEDYDEDRIVEIDAPMLIYLRISDARTTSFIIKSPPSIVEADIDTVFNLISGRRLGVANEVQKREMVRDFLIGISNVKDLTIASSTLEVIYDYSRYVQLPVFRNLFLLRVTFDSYMWEMLPVFLEVCPNLKHLVVGTSENPKTVGITVIARPWNLLSSLEHVDIERHLKGEALEMSLVGYFLESSPNLKTLVLSLDDSLKKGESAYKLTLSLDDAPKKEESDIFIELLNFPRLSSSCKIVV